MPYKDKEKAKQCRKRWQKSHPEAQLRSTKKWKKKIGYYENYQKEKIERDFSMFLQAILRSVKASDKKYDRENDIDINYVMDLLRLQDFCCAATHLPMTHRYHDLRSVSIDRIDNSKGHIKGNIQLTCQGYNLLKRDHPDNIGRIFIQDIEMNLLRKLKEQGYLKLFPTT